jgi:TonB family protein
MLDLLVESKNTSGENSRRSGFLLTTLVIVVSIFLGGILYSLFEKDYGMGGGDLELSTLVAPVPVPQEEPPPPEPEPEQRPVKQEKAAPNVDTRTEIIQRMDQTPVKPPETVSVVQNTVKPPREGIATRIGRDNIDAKDAAPDTYKGRGNTEGTGIKGGTGEARTGSLDGDDAPPPPKPKPTPTPTPKPEPPKKVSLGVINGKASRLVQPSYPPAAKAVRASGAVNVSVSIDVNGNVTSASAVSGHPLLRQAAEQAARQSKFTPTILSGQAVPVTGIIVYNFVMQ